MKQRFKTTLNIDRLNSFMDARGIDAVVARAGLNFTYLAGVAYPGTLARHVDLADSPRAVYAVWPRNGEPYIVLNATALDLAKRDAWIEQMEIYEGYVERPVEGLIRALSKMGLAEATVATYHEAREKKRRRGRPYAMTIGEVRFESIASFRAHLAPVRLKLLTGPDATNRLRQRRAMSGHPYADL